MLPAKRDGDCDDFILIAGIVMTSEKTKLLVIQYNNPAAYPPVMHVCEMFKRAGWEVDVEGVEHWGTHGLECSEQSVTRTSMRRPPTSRWLLPLFWLYFNLIVALRALCVRPAVVHVSDYTAALAACMISLVSRAKIVYHEHDSPSMGGGVKNRVLLELRRWLCRRCEVCILPNFDRAMAFTRQTGCTRPVIVVWNCPSMDEVRAISGRCGSGSVDGSLNVGYAGSINEMRVPPQLIEALAATKNVYLTLVGYETIGSRGYINALEGLAKELGVSERFRYAGVQPLRADVLRLLRENDVCLSLMPMVSDDINMCRMVGASNKTFDAFLCGIPIIVSDLRDWRAAYVDAGVALACDPRDSSSIASVLEWFRSHPVERMRMGAKARRMVEEEWNYEKQFSPVMTALGLGTCSRSQAEIGL